MKRSRGRPHLAQSGKKIFGKMYSESVKVGIPVKWGRYGLSGTSHQ